MTGYIVDSGRRLVLPEAIPGEVYDVEMVSPGHYVARRQGGKRQKAEGRSQIEGLNDETNEQD